MKKIDSYREQLRTLAEWDDYLLAESGLPGPRGNLELAQAAASEGNLTQFEHFLSFTPGVAPTNDPHEFLAFCGALGLAYLASDGRVELIDCLRLYASDPRWRMREAVAMGLQRIGDVDKSLLLTIVQSWAQGGWLEKRAVVAGLAEPRLLDDGFLLNQAFGLFDRITDDLARAQNRRLEAYRVLRQALGYAWSVLAAADPETGRQYLERWFACSDPDVRWVMRENLKKARLQRIDPGWATLWQERLQAK